MREKYNIVIFEVLAKDNKYGLGIFCTTQLPHLYVYNKCRGWIEYDFTYGNMNMIYCNKAHSKFDLVSNKYKYHLEDALLSYKKKWNNAKYRTFILENYLKYFFIETNYYNLTEAEKYSVKILKKCYDCKLENQKRFSYIKPKNKWISEELLYNTIKHMYKDYNVIYQYRPYFLQSSKGGQMSYDIFIKDLNIAIEYQGKQHFEPIKIFGGEKAFIENQKRDILKKQLSIKNGVKLIYINYWEKISEELIKSKIKNVS